MSPAGQHRHGHKCRVQHCAHREQPTRDHQASCPGPGPTRLRRRDAAASESHERPPQQPDSEEQLDDRAGLADGQKRQPVDPRQLSSEHQRQHRPHQGCPENGHQTERHHRSVLGPGGQGCDRDQRARRVDSRQPQTQRRQHQFPHTRTLGGSQDQSRSLPCSSDDVAAETRSNRAMGK